MRRNVKDLKERRKRKTCGNQKEMKRKGGRESEE